MKYNEPKMNLWKASKTASGADLGSSSVGLVHEGYRDDFCDALESVGCTTDGQYSKLFHAMEKYHDAGDFLYSESDQVAEMAVFGLVLLDRLFTAEREGASFGEVFNMHEGVFECLKYVQRGKTVSILARHAARVRHSKTNDAKKYVRSEWLLHSDAYQNNKSEFARHYCRFVKAKLGVTVTEKTIREVWLMSRDSPLGDSPNY